MSLLDELTIKDNVTVEGITADHVWYNAKLLADKMTFWTHDFQKLVSVMEARHKEHLKMIGDLMMERKVLKSEIAELKTRAVAKE
jgi:hypothetical protein